LFDCLSFQVKGKLTSIAHYIEILEVSLVIIVVYTQFPWSFTRHSYHHHLIKIDHYRWMDPFRSRKWSSDGCMISVTGLQLLIMHCGKLF